MTHSLFLHIIKKTNKCIAVVQNSNYAVEGNILVCISCCLNVPKYNFSRFVFHTIWFFLVIWFANLWPSLLKFTFSYSVVSKLNFGSLFWRSCNKAYTRLQTTENWKEKAWKGAKKSTSKALLVFGWNFLVFLWERKEAISVIDAETVKLHFWGDIE